MKNEAIHAVEFIWPTVLLLFRLPEPPPLLFLEPGRLALPPGGASEVDLALPAVNKRSTF